MNKSHVEEIIGTLWLIAALLAFLNDYTFWAWLFVVKALSDYVFSSWIAITESKRKNEN